jgi:crotonobetainyl-CoA:carnitine CoA-transferase CaiB-like acyl-CoA transferase
MAADSRFSSAEARTENKEALFRTLEDVFRTRTLAQWKAVFKKTTLIWSPIQRPDEAVRDPQARANGIFVPFQHPDLGLMKVVANPIRLSRTPASVRAPAPEFNQHTEEILLELGYDWESIAGLKREKVIA